MGVRLAWVLLVVLAGRAAASEMQPVLAKAGAALGVTFTQYEGAPGSFAATLRKGLSACDRIDVHVPLRDGNVEVLALPQRAGARVKAPATLPAEPACAPLLWEADDAGELRARHAFAWADGGAAELERALLAAPAVDRAVADLLPALEPMAEEEIAAKLKEAAAADEAGRNRILAALAPYLPELVPAAEPGKAAFRAHGMNARGAAFDAFRFRVPAEGGERRLVWCFAYPPGTAKGWYAAPVGGDAPKFRNFHVAKSVDGVPAGHAAILQRSETPLRPGADYVIWFQFKVDTPVEMQFALACLPFVKSDRDGLAPLAEALGLKAR